MAKQIVMEGFSLSSGITTETGVREMQRKIGTTVDGVWGPKTQNAYDKFLVQQAKGWQNAPSSKRFASKGEVDYAKTIYGLSLGVGKSDAGSHVIAGYQTPQGVNTAADVKRIQTQLGVRADGIWGKETDGAYRRWSTANQQMNNRKEETASLTGQGSKADSSEETSGRSENSRFWQDGLTKGTVPSLTYISPTQKSITGIGLSKYVPGKRQVIRDFRLEGDSSLFYLDRPHLVDGKDLSYHINQKALPNFNSKQSARANALDEKIISKGVYDTFGDFNKVVKTAKIGGAALTAVGVALDIYDVGTAVYADLNDADKKIGKKTAAAAGGAVLGWAGGALGAKAGAMGGAAIGTAILPGLGTVIGGFVGGLVGGIAGSIAGRGVSNTVVDAIDWEEDR